MPEQPARHTLVWLAAQADWQADLPAQEARLAAWFARGWPAVVARRAADDPDPRLRLGVPLPPGEGKQRLALRVPLLDITRQQAPPTLAELIAAPGLAHPPAWAPALQALDAIAPARVFGAFAWQALTGLAYVHAGSDIDLLWRVHSPDVANRLVTRLHAWEVRFGRRVDGELLLASGAAVNWREYAGTTRQVLLKCIDGASLAPREALFDAAGVPA
ncbi:malonate decarboxylase holo-[acyl-carrier-protein] synthase [Stenotrophomonas nematodicola]|uniref:Malonate decarboxylase holo-[acyl-carrier-protein] synthase n=1 Tax=Stenotrophomonas nematodicola TaxID=2656746 RepID=A0ABW7CU51_9GAMM